MERLTTEAKYLQSEYNYTQNMSMAGKLIRVQAEQIREDPAEYVARKCRRNKYTGSRH